VKSLENRPPKQLASNEKESKLKEYLSRLNKPWTTTSLFKPPTLKKEPVAPDKESPKSRKDPDLDRLAIKG
jgi:hypothetical protein